MYDKEMYVLVSSRHVPNLTKLDPENGKMDGVLFVAEEGMNFMLYVLKMPGDTSFVPSIINNILISDNIYFFDLGVHFLIHFALDVCSNT